MFARVLRCHLRAGKIDQAVELFENNVLPQCRQQPGFKGAYFLINPATREYKIITLWANEEAMLASETNRFFQQQVAKFIPFYEGSPVREAYEVVLKAGAKKT